MSEASEAVKVSAWPGLLPADVVTAWKEVDPQAPKILLDEIVRDARHTRRMAWARLISAMSLIGASMALSAYFVSSGSIVGGGVAVTGGTLTVVTLLLTGRPPALRRK